jgi:hypothetical protein
MPELLPDLDVTAVFGPVAIPISRAPSRRT